MLRYDYLEDAVWEAVRFCMRSLFHHKLDTCVIFVP